MSVVVNLHPEMPEAASRPLDIRLRLGWMLTVDYTGICQHVHVKTPTDKGTYHRGFSEPRTP